MLSIASQVNSFFNMELIIIIVYFKIYSMQKTNPIIYKHESVHAIVKY